MFESKFRVEALVFCVLVAVVGIFFSNILAVQEWEVQTLLVSMVYLLFMAFLEEVAWRGFRLSAVVQKKNKVVAILLVSIEWAVWHIPMWAMRNLIGIGEIVFWILYTVIVGCILGKAFIRYRNILVPILIHTIFNVCFLMSVVHV